MADKKIKEPFIFVFGEPNKFLVKYFNECGKTFCVSNSRNTLYKSRSKLYVDLTESGDAVKYAIDNNHNFIGRMSKHIEMHNLRGGKLTVATEVTFEENVAYHVNRYFKGELQEEFIK